jgi:hypothetical protein
VNSHADKLFRKQKRVGYFVTMGIIVLRDNEHKTAVKGNDDGGWSFDGLVLWLNRRQNRDVVELWGEWSILR